MKPHALGIIIVTICTSSCAAAPRVSVRDAPSVNTVRTVGGWMRTKFPNASFRAVHADLVQPAVAGRCPIVRVTVGQTRPEVRAFATAADVSIADLRTLPSVPRESATLGRRQYDLALEEPRYLGGDTAEVTVWNMPIGTRDTLFHVYRVVGTDVTVLSNKICNPEPVD